MVLLVMQQHVVLVAVKLGPDRRGVEVCRHGHVRLEARGRDCGAVVTADLAASASGPLADIAVAIVGWGGGFEVALDALIHTHVLAAEVAHANVHALELELALTRARADLVTSVLTRACFVPHSQFAQCTLIPLEARTRAVEAQAVSVTVVDTGDLVTCWAVESIVASADGAAKGSGVRELEAATAFVATALVTVLVGWTDRLLTGTSAPFFVAEAHIVLAVAVAVAARFVADLQHLNLGVRHIAPGVGNRARVSASGCVAALASPAKVAVAEWHHVGAGRLLAGTMVITHPGTHVDRTIQSTPLG